MTAARLDENGGHRFDREQLPIQFNLSFTFQHEINLRHLLVIMRAGILFDIDDVQGGNLIVRRGECPAREFSSLSFHIVLAKSRAKVAHTNARVAQRELCNASNLFTLRPNTVEARCGLHFDQVLAFQKQFSSNQVKRRY